MISLLLGTATTVPHINLSCDLDPAKSSMHISCRIQVPDSFLKTQTLKFQLGDAMSMPKVIACGKNIDNEVPVTKGTLDGHEQWYSVPTNGCKEFKFEYSSEKPQGNVYMLDPRECFCGGYNTLWYPVFGDSRRMLGNLSFSGPMDFIVKATGADFGYTKQGQQKISAFTVQNPSVLTFAAAPFHVTRLPGKVPVTVFMLSDRKDNERFAKGCAENLAVLEKEFGPYPFPDFSIIETPSPDSSQLGFTGASFEGFMFGDTNSIDAGFNRAYFGHEMSHQWWGNLVQSEGDKGDFALSEALAQYGSLQTVRELEGVELAKQYRINGYPGYSDWQCFSGVMAFGVTKRDHPLSAVGGEFANLHHLLANSKGFLAWETLAQTMGHDAFRRALKGVTKRYGWGAISWDRFWEDLQLNTKVDLKTFRQEWFERPGIPTVWTRFSQSNGKVTIDLHQKAPTFHMHLPLVVTTRDGNTKTQWVDFNQESQTIVIDESRPVLSAALDPDHETLHSTPEMDEYWQANRVYAEVDLFQAMLGKRATANGLLEDELKNLPSPDKAGTEFLLRFTLSGNLRVQGKLKEAKEQLQMALACPVRKAEFVPLAFLRLAVIAQTEKDYPMAKLYVDSMVAAESQLKFPSGAIERAKVFFPNLQF